MDQHPSASVVRFRPEPYAARAAIIRQFMDQLCHNSLGGVASLDYGIALTHS